MSVTASTTRNRSLTWPPFAAVAIGVTAVLLAIGTFWSPLADYESTRNTEDLISWLVMVAISAVGAGIVFGVFARRATPSKAGTPAIVLAGLGVLSIAVFWTGLPTVFAAGSAYCALLAGRGPRSMIALGISALVVAGAVALALAG